MLTVSTMVITALAVGTIVLNSGSWLRSPLMACITIPRPLAFFWARECEMPSAAFAAVSLALATGYASGGERLDG